MLSTAVDNNWIMTNYDNTFASSATKIQSNAWVEVMFVQLYVTYTGEVQKSQVSAWVSDEWYGSQHAASN